MQWMLGTAASRRTASQAVFCTTAFFRAGDASCWAAYRSPDRFAALVPVAGFDVPYGKRNPCVLASIPMWIIAGRKDKVVSASGAEAFIALMKSCGIEPRYTLYDTNNIETAKRAYRNPELYNWMVSQSRGNI
jgi:predicted peptidase